MPSSLAARNAGKAIMMPKVPALPHQVTSMRLAPSAMIDTTQIDRITSRATTTSPNQSGQPSTTMIDTTPTISSNRSTVGSNALPKFDTWFRCRAA